MTADKLESRLLEIDARLSNIEDQQRVFLAILGQLVATAEAHSEMLGDILGAAQQEPGPSETADALSQLALAVHENTSAVREMNEQFTTLPTGIATEITKVLGEAPPVQWPR